eukprot:CAMPEP_0178915942 /NCGR_PEP_ID=MMETSP0786-20121207/12333_1 /TAXON_ID=186022 /ORGANISM="Thalassionema frauenfeldii, Strain CCMP 1798" /LENGTH=258 /DNA_ID=CAMNT_0020589161 /DNA_START=54 /DNA_END=830 /DNA_ORIENTATION=+
MSCKVQLPAPLIFAPTHGVKITPPCLSGRDWMLNYQQTYVDVKHASPSNHNNKKSSDTDWEKMFLKGIGVSTSSNGKKGASLFSANTKPSTVKASGPVMTSTFDEAVEGIASIRFVTPEQPPTLAFAKKKHFRPQLRNRRNWEPIVKKYVTPTENDILLHRGSRSSHNPGHKAFLEKAGEIREICARKSSQKDLAQYLVHWVQREQRGRFLKQDVDNQKWYVVTNCMARRFASIALRERKGMPTFMGRNSAVRKITIL